MADKYKNFPVGRSDPGMKHFTITPSNTVDLTVRPRVIYCQTAGNVVLVDALGVELTYALVAGQILPFSPVRVKATGTTATIYGWI